MSPPDSDPLQHVTRAGRHAVVVREVRKLMRSADERRKRKVLVVEGISAAREVLSGHFQTLHALASPRLAATPQGRELAECLRGLGPRARLLEDTVLGSLSDVESSQGILLVLNRPRWDLTAVLHLARRPMILVALGIQDPGNLGALARVAEASGATALVSIGGADPWGPKAVRSSAGSIPRLPVVEAAHAPAVLSRLSKAGLRLFGAAPHDAPSYREVSMAGPLALVMGSEGAGLPPQIASAMDQLVRIPLKHTVESLNVATAAAVLLFNGEGSEPER